MTLKMAVIVAAIFFLLLSTLAFNSPVVVKGETNEAGFIIKTSVTYYNNGTENWVFTDQDRGIGLFMNNTWQTVQLINHSYPIENSTVDEDKNPIAFLQFPKTEIDPGENVSYTVTYYALSKPRLLPDIKEENSGTLADIPEKLIERYCGEGDAWLVNDTELQELAHSIAPNETNVLTIVKEFVAWIRENIKYPYPGELHKVSHENPLYPNETFKYKEGDCDDQAILFITLCRIRKIPSYLQIGYVYDTTIQANETSWGGHERIFQKGIGGHGWAIAYIPPWGWLPVDLTFWRYSPLNAIKTAAVTSQSVIQYMNVSQMDYVASQREAERLLEKNGFYVYARYEMTQTLPEGLLDRGVGLFPWILVIAIVVVVVAAVFIRVRRATKGNNILQKETIRNKKI
jgi:transglutaminase-like putative cysteine protease